MKETISRRAAILLTVCVLAAAVGFLLFRSPLRTEYPQDAVAAYLEKATGEKLDLNTADETALASLPGIGSVKAHAITEYRAACGGFSSAEQLLEVPGLGPATWEKLRELVTVGPTAEMENG